MIQFFLHRKFWLPIVLIIGIAVVLELLLRLGIYDDFIKPRSYLGNAVYREKALQDFGLENVHWITIGDSRLDWGIEHEKILKLQKDKGINHLRMSFESSNFLALQSTVEWSMANMPNLEGIFLGVGENNFGHYDDVSKQYNVAWPFRNFINYDDFKYFHPNFWKFSYLSRFALYVYFFDIKELFQKSMVRFKQISHYQSKEHSDIFSFKRDLPNDVCEFELDSIQQCVKTANRHIDQVNNKGAFNFIQLVCGNDYSQRRAQNNTPFHKKTADEQLQISNNWKKLFDKIFSNGKKLKVVLLPEHQMFNYAVKPTNSVETMNMVLDSYRSKSDFELIDFRNLFAEDSSHKECEYFSDPLHLNNLGMTKLTQAIVERLREK